MTIEKQLADALRQGEDKLDWLVHQNPPHLFANDLPMVPLSCVEDVLQPFRSALAAYDARPVAGDEQVERAIIDARFAGDEDGSGDMPITDYDRDLARAALSAMHPAELRIGGFVLRPAPNGIWIGRDGEGGEFATDRVERWIAQYYRVQF